MRPLLHLFLMLLFASCGLLGKKNKKAPEPEKKAVVEQKAKPEDPPAVLYVPKPQPHQQRGDILAGDSIFITTPADGREFANMELYTKSRFTPVPYKWDTITGEGFYEYWFTVGDFDSRVLPIEYSNTWVRIISIKNFRDRENNMMTVFFCKGKGPFDVIWLMMEKAVLAGEAELPKP